MLQERESQLDVYTSLIVKVLNFLEEKGDWATEFGEQLRDEVAGQLTFFLMVPNREWLTDETSEARRHDLFLAKFEALERSIDETSNAQEKKARAILFFLQTLVLYTRYNEVEKNPERAEIMLNELLVERTNFTVDDNFHKTIAIIIKHLIPETFPEDQPVIIKGLYDWYIYRISTQLDEIPAESTSTAIYQPAREFRVLLELPALLFDTTTRLDDYERQIYASYDDTDDYRLVTEYGLTELDRSNLINKFVEQKQYRLIFFLEHNGLLLRVSLSEIVGFEIPSEGTHGGGAATILAMLRLKATHISDDLLKHDDRYKASYDALDEQINRIKTILMSLLSGEPLSDEVVTSFVKFHKSYGRSEYIEGIVGLLGQEVVISGLCSSEAGQHALIQLHMYFPRLTNGDALLIHLSKHVGFKSSLAEKLPVSFRRAVSVTVKNWTTPDGHTDSYELVGGSEPIKPLEALEKKIIPTLSKLSETDEVVEAYLNYRFALLDRPWDLSTSVIAKVNELGRLGARALLKQHFGDSLHARLYDRIADSDVTVLQDAVNDILNVINTVGEEEGDALFLLYVHATLKRVESLGHSEHAAALLISMIAIFAQYKKESVIERDEFLDFQEERMQELTLKQVYGYFDKKSTFWANKSISGNGEKTLALMSKIIMSLDTVEKSDALLAKLHDKMSDYSQCHDFEGITSLYFLLSISHHLRFSTPDSKISLLDLIPFIWIKNTISHRSVSLKEENTNSDDYGHKAQHNTNGIMSIPHKAREQSVYTLRHYKVFWESPLTKKLAKRQLFATMAVLLRNKKLWDASACLGENSDAYKEMNNTFYSILKIANSVRDSSQSREEKNAENATRIKAYTEIFRYLQKPDIPAPMKAIIKVALTSIRGSRYHYTSDRLYREFHGVCKLLASQGRRAVIRRYQDIRDFPEITDAFSADMKALMALDNVKKLALALLNDQTIPAIYQAFEPNDLYLFFLNRIIKRNPANKEVLEEFSARGSRQNTFLLLAFCFGYKVVDAETLFAKVNKLQEETRSPTIEYLLDGIKHAYLIEALASETDDDFILGQAQEILEEASGSGVHLRFVAALLSREYAKYNRTLGIKEKELAASLTEVKKILYDFFDKHREEVLNLTRTSILDAARLYPAVTREDRMLNLASLLIETKHYVSAGELLFKRRLYYNSTKRGDRGLRMCISPLRGEEVAMHIVRCQATYDEYRSSMVVSIANEFVLDIEDLPTTPKEFLEAMAQAIRENEMADVYKLWLHMQTHNKLRVNKSFVTRPKELVYKDFVGVKERVLDFLRAEERFQEAVYFYRDEYLAKDDTSYQKHAENEAFMRVMVRENIQGADQTLAQDVKSTTSDEPTDASARESIKASSDLPTPQATPVETIDVYAYSRSPRAIRHPRKENADALQQALGLVTSGDEEAEQTVFNYLDKNPGLVRYFVKKIAPDVINALKYNGRWKLLIALWGSKCLDGELPGFAALLRTIVEGSDTYRTDVAEDLKGALSLAVIDESADTVFGQLGDLMVALKRDKTRFQEQSRDKKGKGKASEHEPLVNDTAVSTYTHALVYFIELCHDYKDNSIVIDILTKLGQEAIFAYLDKHLTPYNNTIKDVMQYVVSDLQGEEIETEALETCSLLMISDALSKSDRQFVASLLQKHLVVLLLQKQSTDMVSTDDVIKASPFLQSMRNMLRQVAGSYEQEEPPIEPTTTTLVIDEAHKGKITRKDILIWHTKLHRLEKRMKPFSKKEIQTIARIIAHMDALIPGIKSLVMDKSSLYQLRGEKVYSSTLCNYLADCLSISLGLENEVTVLLNNWADKYRKSRARFSKLKYITFLDDLVDKRATEICLSSELKPSTLVLIEANLILSSGTKSFPILSKQALLLELLIIHHPESDVLKNFQGVAQPTFIRKFRRAILDYNETAKEAEKFYFPVANERPGSDYVITSWSNANRRLQSVVKFLVNQRAYLTLARLHGRRGAWANDIATLKEENIFGRSGTTETIEDVNIHISGHANSFFFGGFRNPWPTDQEMLESFVREALNNRGTRTLYRLWAHIFYLNQQQESTPRNRETRLITRTPSGPQRINVSFTEKAQEDILKYLIEEKRFEEAFHFFNHEMNRNMSDRHSLTHAASGVAGEGYSADFKAWPYAQDEFHKAFLDEIRYSLSEINPIARNSLFAELYLHLTEESESEVTAEEGCVSSEDLASQIETLTNVILEESEPSQKQQAALSLFNRLAAELIKSEPKAEALDAAKQLFTHEDVLLSLGKQGEIDLPYAAILQHLLQGHKAWDNEAWELMAPSQAVKQHKIFFELFRDFACDIITKNNQYDDGTPILNFKNEKRMRLSVFKFLLEKKRFETAVSFFVSCYAEGSDHKSELTRDMMLLLDKYRFIWWMIRRELNALDGDNSHSMLSPIGYITLFKSKTQRDLVHDLADVIHFEDVDMYMSWLDHKPLYDQVQPEDDASSMVLKISSDDFTALLMRLVDSSRFDEAIIFLERAVYMPAYHDLRITEEGIERLKENEAFLKYFWDYHADNQVDLHQRESAYDKKALAARLAKASRSIFSRSKPNDPEPPRDHAFIQVSKLASARFSGPAVAALEEFKTCIEQKRYISAARVLVNSYSEEKLGTEMTRPLKSLIDEYRIYLRTHVKRQLANLKQHSGLAETAPVGYALQGEEYDGLKVTFDSFNSSKGDPEQLYWIWWAIQHHNFEVKVNRGWFQRPIDAKLRRAYFMEIVRDLIANDRYEEAVDFIYQSGNFAADELLSFNQQFVDNVFKESPVFLRAVYEHWKDNIGRKAPHDDLAAYHCILHLARCEYDKTYKSEEPVEVIHLPHAGPIEQQAENVFDVEGMTPDAIISSLTARGRKHINRQLAIIKHMKEVFPGYKTKDGAVTALPEAMQLKKKTKRANQRKSFNFALRIRLNFAKLCYGLRYVDGDLASQVNAFSAWLDKNKPAEDATDMGKLRYQTVYKYLATLFIRRLVKASLSGEAFAPEVRESIKTIVSRDDFYEITEPLKLDKALLDYLFLYGDLDASFEVASKELSEDELLIQMFVKKYGRTIMQQENKQVDVSLITFDLYLKEMIPSIVNFLLDKKDYAMLVDLINSREDWADYYEVETLQFSNVQTAITGHASKLYPYLYENAQTDFAAHILTMAESSFRVEAKINEIKTQLSTAIELGRSLETHQLGEPDQVHAICQGLRKRRITKLRVSEQVRNKLLQFFINDGQYHAALSMILTDYNQGNGKLVTSSKSDSVERESKGTEEEVAASEIEAEKTNQDEVIQNFIEQFKSNEAFRIAACQMLEIAPTSMKQITKKVRDSFWSSHKETYEVKRIMIDGKELLLNPGTLALAIIEIAEKDYNNFSVGEALDNFGLGEVGRTPTKNAATISLRETSTVRRLFGLPGEGESSSTGHENTVTGYITDAGL